MTAVDVVAALVCALLFAGVFAVLVWAAPANDSEPSEPVVCDMCHGSGVWRSTTSMGRRVIAPCSCGLGVPK